MLDYIPVIDESIPLPKSAAEALPSLTPTEELDMRVRTIKLLADLAGKPLIPNKDNAEEALDLAKQMITDPHMRPDYAKYPNETLAYLAGMVQQMNVQLVDDLSDFKHYVINKLVHEVENASSSKDRISALNALGNVDGVDAFKKRSEMVVKHQSIEEVERELLGVLENVSYKVLKDPEALDQGRDRALDQGRELPDELAI